MKKEPSNISFGKLPLIFSLTKIGEAEKDTNLYSSINSLQTPTHLCRIFYKPISRVCRTPKIKN